MKTKSITGHRRWLSVLASAALIATLGLQTASAAKPIPAVTFVDYAQCVDGTTNDAATNCPSGWINGILQASNSTYHEDEVTPQRAEVNVPAGATLSHSVTFTYQARKGSAGVHAYDSLATWNYTQTTADRSQGLDAADVVGGSGKQALIPADPTVIAPFTSLSGATSAHELADADRQMTAFGLQAGSTLSVSTPVHDCATAVPNVCADPTKDDYASITVTYTLTDTTAARKIQFLFGGHLASAVGPRGWGSGLGSSSISGGPYHIKWTASDGASIGNRDNQIMGSAIIFNDTGITTKVRNTNGTDPDTDVANNGHVAIGAVLYDTATLNGATATAGGTVTYYVEKGDATCSIAGATSLGAKTVTNGSVPNSSNTSALSSAGTYRFWAVYTGDANNGTSTSACDSEVVVVDANTVTVSTQVKNTNGANADTDVANNGHVAIGAVLYDTATLTGATSNAGGTISYGLFSDSGCTVSVDDLTPATNTVTNGSAPASDTHTFDTAGTFYFQATYSGDANNNNSVPVSSGCSTEIVVVDANAVTVSTQVKNTNGANADTDVANNGHVAIGAVLYDTATLTGATSNAGGTISYGLFSDSGCTVSVDDLTPATNTVTNGSAPASDTHTFDTAGTFYFQATYSGDANNNNSVPVSSGCSTEIVVVDANAVTVSTQVKNTNGANADTDVANNGHVAIGAVLYDTATLTGATSNAGGTISYGLFSDSGCTVSVDDLTPATNTVTNGSAPASDTHTFDTAGTFYFQATYSGDANNNNSVPVSSGCSTEIVVVDQNAPGIGTAQNLLPNDDATLSGLTSTAGGTVLFELFGPGDTTCTGSTVYSQSVSVSGNGTYSTTNTATVVTVEGTYRWKVYYSGDVNNKDATSACGVEQFTFDNSSV